jgi:hypothetical protein
VKLTWRASCCGDDVRTVDKSSTLLRDTSNTSFVSSGLKPDWESPPASLKPKLSALKDPEPSVADLDIDCGGVKIGAKLSVSRPGKTIPLDFKLCNISPCMRSGC